MPADLPLLGYLLAFGTSALGCLAGAWRARRIEHAGVRRGLVGLLGVSGLWALSHVGVLLSPSLPLKTAFYVAGLTVGFGTVWAWVWFCSSYSGRSLHERKAARWAALAVFGTVTLTKLTNPWHGLYFTAEWAAVPFKHLAIDYHVIYWVTTSLSYALAGVGFFMLIEPLRRVQVGGGTLAGLFGLMALPLGANAVGYATPYLLDLSHEPIGVAAFSIGVLFVLRNRFEETGRAGTREEPVLVLSEEGQLRNYNEAAAERFPALRREGAAGTALEDALPRLAEVLGGADEADRPEETGRPEKTGRLEGTGRPEGPDEISPQDEARPDETRQGETRQDEILELEGSEGEVRYFRAAESRFRRGGGQAVILTDVTERELRRRNRESRLEVLCERSPDMIDVHDAEGRVLEANARFFEKTGYRAADLPGLKVWDIDESIGREEAAELWAGMEVGDRRRLEGAYRRKDGSTFPVEVHVRRLQMEGEDRFVAIARDTTERKRAERQRQRERDRLETLFESLPTPVVRCRVEGGEPTVADANSAFGETFGPAEEEVEGKALNDLVVPEGGQEEAAEIDRRALEKSPVETEVRRSAANGPRDFHLQMAGRKPERGPAEVYAIYTDITERKERERRLRQAETLFRNAQDALFLIDVDPSGAESEEGKREFSVRRVNPAYEAATGFSGEDLRGQSPRDIFGEEVGREVEERYRRCARRQEPIEYEEELPVGGETARWQTRIAPVMAEGEVQQIVGTTRDVTEERRRERELRRQKTLLEQAQRLAGAWEADLRTGEVSWSEKVYEIHEMDPSAEVSLEEGLGFYAPESRSRVEKATQALVEEGTPYDAELQIDTAEGNRRWVRTVGAPVETEGAGKEGGEVTKIAGAFQDITERKEAERRRKQVIRRVTGGIVEVDSEWRFTLVNEQAEQICGLDREEMLGKSLWEVFPGLEGTEFEEVYREVMRAREPARIEEYYQGLGGWFDVQVYPNEDGGLAAYFEEITERKEAEEELRRSREQLSMALEGGNIGTWNWDLETDRVVFNDQWAEMLGYSREELDFQFSTWEELVHPEDLPRAMEMLDAYIDGETDTYDPEIRMRTKSGDWKWIRTVGKVVERGSGGAVTRAAGIHLDIDERKRAEEELQRSRERYRSLFEDSNDAILVCDLEGRIQEVNPQAKALFGREAGALEGQSIRDLHAPDEQETAAEKLAALRAGESYQAVSRYRRADDSEFWGEVSAGTTDIGDREVVRILIRDVTKRKRRKRKLERQNDLFERAQEIADVGAWEYDVQSGEATWTENAYRLVGLPPSAGNSPENTFQLYHEEDRPRVKEAFSRAIEEGRPFDLEARLNTEGEATEGEATEGEATEGEATEEGEERWVRVRGEPQRENGNPEGEVVRVRGTIQDITERKRRERGLREAKEEAERAKEEAEKSRREAEKAKEEAKNASQMKSSLLANMSHEIRTPLTSIIGFAEALGAESAELELPEGSALPKYAELIEKGGKRLLQTLEGVLNLSKLEAGQMELSSEAVGLGEEARRAAEELGPDAQEKQIDLRRETQEVSAWADEGGIQIVLRNLLSNAIKYTGEGGRIWVRTYRVEGRAVLEVEDTGIGMEPSVAEELFEPFRQASEGWGRKYEGTGVGLAVTREAVEQMGGTIEVETEEGEGSRFTVQFPQAGDAGETSGAETRDG